MKKLGPVGGFDIRRFFGGRNFLLVLDGATNEAIFDGPVRHLVQESSVVRLRLQVDVESVAPGPVDAVASLIVGANLREKVKIQK